MATTASIEAVPNVFADQLGGQFLAGLLYELGPPHAHHLGDLIICCLEGLPQGAVFGVGDKNHRFNLSVICLVLGFGFGDTFFLFSVQSPLLGQS